MLAARLCRGISRARAGNQGRVSDRMARQRVHVVFGDSPAGILRQGLRQSGSTDLVLSFADNLAFGPIKGGRPDRRTGWSEAGFCLPDDDGCHFPTEADLTPFWERYHQATDCKTIWVSRRSSREYCGFLECLYRTHRDDRIQVNDLTDQRLPQWQDGGWVEQPVCSTGHLNVENLMRFYANGSPLPSSRRREFIREWTALREENGAFRVFADGKLVSVPISYFDESLLSNMRAEWRKALQVVGDTQMRHWGDHFDDLDEDVLFTRLKRLAMEGRIDARGDRAQIHRLEFRKA